MNSLSFCMDVKNHTCRSHGTPEIDLQRLPHRRLPAQQAGCDGRPPRLQRTFRAPHHVHEPWVVPASQQQPPWGCVQTTRSDLSDQNFSSLGACGEISKQYFLGNGPHLRAAASATARPNSPAEGMLPASRPPGAAGRLSGGGSGGIIPPRRALKSAGRPPDSCATACPAPLVSFSAALQLQYFRRLLVKWNDNQRAAGSRMV